MNLLTETETYKSALAKIKLKRKITKKEKNENVKTQNGMKKFPNFSVVGLQRMPRHCNVWH